MRRIAWRVRFALQTRPKSDREAVAHLAWRAARSPRHVEGEAILPFGAIRYIDALSLRWQYEEIILEGSYDFSIDIRAPRIVDCGANVGLSIFRFKSLFPASSVIAFEADPIIRGVLKENISRLGLTNVEVVSAAAWTENGMVGFRADGGDSGRLDPAGIPVAAVRLADLIDGPVDLLKLDVEGAEFELLQDLARTDTLRWIRRLVCEVHGDSTAERRLDELLSTLRTDGMSYSVGSARSAPDLPGRPEPTPFGALQDGKYLLHLYAWRDLEDLCAS